jgi:acyl-CoA reductase-like NAD-dependent aldehyde dehydrogenase
MKTLDIKKTYKLYINGEFPRTESGRYYPLLNKKNEIVANVCLASRKDFRNAVVAARNAQTSWAERAAMNKAQILYRMAEMLEGRKAQFIDELLQQGESKSSAEREIQLAIDCCVYYCGWCDKYQSLYSSVNPVASSHFNFSVPEPMGVVAIIAPEKPSLLGLLNMLLPIIAGGNTCIVLASTAQPLCSITLGEVFASSDLPSGVVNILTGTTNELITHFASHMDVNALVYGKENKEEWEQISILSSNNVKRSMQWEYDWYSAAAQNPYLILEAQEIKTTWHPIEQIGISGAKY